MIDVEKYIFNTVATELRTQIENISIYGEYVNSPAKFPCVTITEQDNYTHTQSLPLSNIPVATNLLYEINIYSNLETGKKEQCKNIAKIIDDKMVELGFRLISLNPIPNLNNATIYRLVARYRKLQTI